MRNNKIAGTIVAGVFGLSSLGAIGATVASASPSGMPVVTTMSHVVEVKPVIGHTYSPEHFDTTSVATGLNSPGGPLWAYDYLHETFTATPGHMPGTWNVTIDVRGTFDGFASPTVANKAEVNKGKVIGTISYVVTSPNKPRAGELPRIEPNYTGLGTALNQFFGGSETVTGGGHYNFSYHNVDGVVYSQIG